MDTAPLLSCEFFPPNTDEGMQKLRVAHAALVAIRPLFCSVTYGAGGSTRARTLEAIAALHGQHGIEAAPHLTCVGATRASILELLDTYRALGIRRIVALRGDLPSGTREFGEFQYANELVSFIRAETGSHFHLEVAAYPECHPQAPSAVQDMLNFRRKVDAGANSAITQYFYTADAYFRFREECEQAGVSIPIFPGIMPITNFTQLARFSDNCGTEIPRWMRKRLEGFGDDRASIRAFGLDVVTDLCQWLLAGGAPGLHFYTMNQSALTLAICERLGLIGGVTS